MPRPKTPSPSKKGKEKASTNPPSSKKKNKFHDHDPYRLPPVDLASTISQAHKSHPAASDPRLATEDELRSFIEEMRPEDFDVSSPQFRELPTEVQYEIIGDLRLKSRQTSYTRLQSMLRSAPTPLDFSRQQIKNLKQRNELTQQLLMTTDSIGKAHLTIPVRIAAERNREYVLVKNEGEGGGWILGIRDEGTMDKPIEIDRESEHESDEEAEGGMSDVEMEEVNMYVVGILYRLILTIMAISQDQELQYLIPIFGNTNETWRWLPSASDRQDFQDHVQQEQSQRKNLCLRMMICQCFKTKQKKNIQMAIQSWRSLFRHLWTKLGQIRGPKFLFHPKLPREALMMMATYTHRLRVWKLPWQLQARVRVRGYYLLRLHRHLECLLF